MRLPLALLILFVWAGVGAAEDDAPVSLSLSVEKDHCYQGEHVPVSVTLRVKQATVRNIGYPALASPTRLAAGFAAPEKEREGTGDAETELYSFWGILKATAPGDVAVGPASISCEVLDAAAGTGGFFGAVEPRLVQLRSNAARLTVLPLPRAGRPSSFHGAIGSFTVTATAVPARYTPGDPVTVRTVIRGEGNLDSAGCPDLSAPGVRSYPVTSRRGPELLACEQVLVPSAGAELPQLAWSFFDPGSSRYRTVARKLAASPAAPPPSPPRQAPLIAPAAATTSESPSLLLPTLVAALGGVVGIPTWYLRRRSQRPAAGNRAAGEATVASTGLEAAAEAGDVGTFYTSVFAILQQRLSPEVGLPSATVSSPPATCPPAIRALWERCERVRYGGGSVNLREMREDLVTLKSLQ